MSVADRLAAEELWAARWLFTRGLALVYLIAFVAALDQFRPLLGERGLLPVPARPGRRFGPTLFRWGYSDRRLVVLSTVGAVLAAAVVAGLGDLDPWVAMAAWLLLWLLYLSIVNVGQTLLLVRVGVAAAGVRVPRRVPRRWGDRAAGAGDVAAVVAAVPGRVGRRPHQDAG